MADVVTIGGREFRPVLESTVEHDLWTMERVRRAGLDKLEMEPGEDPGLFSQRILFELVRSGSAMEMLGAVLVPADVDPLDWSPAMALESASFFRRVSDPDSKLVIQNQLIELLMGFLGAGIISVAISRRFSGKEMGNRPVTEDITTGANGQTLSAPSPDTTRAAARTLPPAGRSGKRFWPIWPFSRPRRGNSTEPNG